MPSGRGQALWPFSSEPDTAERRCSFTHRRRITHRVHVHDLPHHRLNIHLLWRVFVHMVLTYQVSFCRENQIWTYSKVRILPITHVATFLTLQVDMRGLDVHIVFIGCRELLRAYRTSKHGHVLQMIVEVRSKDFCVWTLTGWPAISFSVGFSFF